MFSRAQPEIIGASQGYNPSCDTFTSGGWNDAFDYIALDPLTTPSASQLKSARMGELSADWVNQITSDWYSCVLKYQTIGINNKAICGYLN
jgi:hypothetical protein